MAILSASSQMCVYRTWQTLCILFLYAHIAYNVFSRVATLSRMHNIGKRPYCLGAVHNL